jgi:hypothetical protein
MTLLGSKFIRKLAIRDASFQNFKAIDACASNETPTSTK